MATRRIVPAALVIALAVQIAPAQHRAPFDPQFSIPVAPQGLAHRKLPDLPLEYDTAEGERIRVPDTELEHAGAGDRPASS